MQCIKSVGQIHVDPAQKNPAGKPTHMSRIPEATLHYGTNAFESLASHYVSTEEYNSRLSDAPEDPMALCAGVPRYAHMNSVHREAEPKRREVKDNFVAKVVQKCGNAIVRIETERYTSAGLEGDLFSFFFGHKHQPESKVKVHAHGSGFCIEGGVVLTNAHVIADADSIMVSFPDGKKHKAKLLGADEVLDVAALQVDTSPRVVVPLGSSCSVKVGDWAVVLGHPLGLNNTVTLGIISSLDRSSGETGWDWMRHALMQTDAAVNQGNSGGPLLNELGQCVGIISMRALFGEGIGFAIPIDSVRNALASILQQKSVPHAYLGIKMQKGDHVAIDAVLPDSPAERAGVCVGDVIVEADGVRVTKMDDVQCKVRLFPVGKDLKLKLKRDKATVNVVVRTADAKELKTRKKQKSRIVVVP